MASIHSTDSDDFVVIVPDCFDLSKPLPGYTPPVIEPEFQNPFPILSCDSLVTSFVRSEPEVRHKPAAIHPSAPPQPSNTVETSSSGNSPPTGRREFVPRRYTLQNVKDARLYTNPLALATGLVNTVSDLVSDRVRIAKSGNKGAEDVVTEPQVREQEDSDDEEFEVFLSNNF